MLRRDTEKRTEKERSVHGLVVEEAVFGNFPERGVPRRASPSCRVGDPGATTTRGST